MVVIFLSVICLYIYIKYNNTSYDNDRNVKSFCKINTFVVSCKMVDKHRSILLTSGPIQGLRGKKGVEGDLSLSLSPVSVN